MKKRLITTLLLAALAQAAHAAAPLNEWRGISLSGGEWGEKNLPGVYGKDFQYPSVASTAYYQGRGMNLMRIAFLWERLQPTLNGEFDATELARLREFVDGTTAKGLTVLIDPHNYAAFHEQRIGTPSVPIEAFADLWRRLALQFKDNPRVQFGLMNEPHSLKTETWADAAQAAIDAIRRTGARNLITVPGNGYTGAWNWQQNAWYGTPNAEVMDRVHDPLDHMIFEVHQYLDADGSGTKPECVSSSVGAERLAGLTKWLREHKRRAILGEIGAGNNATCALAVQSAMAHMQANADVWAGWLWWAGGPNWGDYFMSLEPGSDGADKPQMQWLTPFLDVRSNVRQVLH